jgi:hypothetical protein
MGFTSFLSAYVGIISIRLVADGSYWILAAAGIEMALWWVGLHTFKDWDGFRGVAPVSIVTTLAGTALGMSYIPVG